MQTDNPPTINDVIAYFDEQIAECNREIAVLEQVGILGPEKGKRMQARRVKLERLRDACTSTPYPLPNELRRTLEDAYRWASDNLKRSWNAMAEIERADPEVSAVHREATGRMTGLLRWIQEQPHAAPPIYSHRNGEITPPTVAGWFTFFGIAHEPDGDITDLQARLAFVAPELVDEWPDPNGTWWAALYNFEDWPPQHYREYRLEELEGRWHGPIPEPE